MQLQEQIFAFNFEGVQAQVEPLLVNLKLKVFQVCLVLCFFSAQILKKSSLHFSLQVRQLPFVIDIGMELFRQHILFSSMLFPTQQFCIFMKLCWSILGLRFAWKFSWMNSSSFEIAPKTNRPPRPVSVALISSQILNDQICYPRIFSSSSFMQPISVQINSGSQNHSNIFLSYFLLQC